MSDNSFRPQGNSVLIAASSSTGLAATQLSTLNTPAAWLANNSTSPIYVSLGSSSVAAGVPTTAAPASGMLIPAGVGKGVNVGPTPSQCWASAVTSAGSALLNATPGSGM